MNYPTQAKDCLDYLEYQLPRLKQSESLIKCYETVALEDRACSSLCELSANICKDDTERTNQEKNCTSKISYSPWTIKKKDYLEEDRVIRQRKLRNVQKKRGARQNFKCNTEDKQNIQNCKKDLSQLGLKKNRSIFFKIVGLREGKNTVDYMSEHPDIQMVACVQKKKFSLIEMRKEISSKKSQVGVQVNRQITPKIVTLQHTKLNQQSRLNTKKLEKSLISNWSQDFKGNRETNPYTQHWKGKKMNKKGKACKRIVIVKQSKSIEVKDIRQTCLIRKKGCVSLDRTKKEQYKSSNPLTRLLYEKYLHTIGICQSKEIPGGKFLQSSKPFEK